MDGQSRGDGSMWRWAASSATGRSHLRSGLPCQDRFGLRVLPNGTLIAALADGAGSATHGAIGAETAVTSVLSSLYAALAIGRTDLDVLMREAAQEARLAVVARSSSEETDSRQYASTLLALVLTLDKGAAMQIGDGVIVVKQENEADWTWLIWPQRGEYANTTFFLTDPAALRHLDVQTFPGSITDATLMSDGLECLALRYADQSVHQPFFSGMIRPLLHASGTDEIAPLSDSLRQFLASEQVSSRTDDDVSIILATRRPLPSSL